MRLRMSLSDSTSSHKRAYFYSLDAFIATIIIATGIFIVVQASSREQPKANVYLLAQDLTNYLSKTRIYDLNDELYPDTIRSWKLNGNITHFDNTILEQAGEFYARGQANVAMYLLSNLTVATAASKYNFDIMIDGGSIFGYYSVPQGKAKSLISSTVIISGIIDSRNPWGPYKAEIRVWQ